LIRIATTGPYDDPVSSPFLGMAGAFAAITALIWLLTGRSSGTVARKKTDRVVGVPMILTVIVTAGMMYVPARGLIGGAALGLALFVPSAIGEALAERPDGRTVLVLWQTVLVVLGAVLNGIFFGEIFGVLSVNISPLLVIVVLVAALLWAV